MDELFKRLARIVDFNNYDCNLETQFINKIFNAVICQHCAMSVRTRNRENWPYSALSYRADKLCLLCIMCSVNKSVV